METGSSTSSLIILSISITKQKCHCHSPSIPGEKKKFTVIKSYKCLYLSLTFMSSIWAIQTTFWNLLLLHRDHIVSETLSHRSRDLSSYFCNLWMCVWADFSVRSAFRVNNQLQSLSMLQFSGNFRESLIVLLIYLVLCHFREFKSDWSFYLLCQHDGNNSGSSHSCFDTEHVFLIPLPLSLFLGLVIAFLIYRSIHYISIFLYDIFKLVVFRSLHLQTLQAQQ